MSTERAKLNALMAVLEIWLGDSLAMPLEESPQLATSAPAAKATVTVIVPRPNGFLIAPP
jgi:hypothetical protein